MPYTATTPALERGTKLFEFVFRDPAGTLVVPTAAEWALTDTNGTPIESYDGLIEFTHQPFLDVALASTLHVKLSGEHLRMLSSTTEEERRRLTVYATADTDFTDDVPIKDWIDFRILQDKGDHDP